MTLAKIRRNPVSLSAVNPKPRGEWYVCRNVLSGDEVEHEYLHSDGMWRSSTYSGAPAFDSPTGYFETEDDAKAALAKARGKTV